MSRKYEPIEDDPPQHETSTEQPLVNQKPDQKKKRTRKRNLIKTVIVTVIVLLLGAITALLILFLVPNFDRGSQYYKELFTDNVSPEELKKVRQIGKFIFFLFLFLSF